MISKHILYLMGILSLSSTSLFAADSARTPQICLFGCKERSCATLPGRADQCLSECANASPTLLSIIKQNCTKYASTTTPVPPKVPQEQPIGNKAAPQGVRGVDVAPAPALPGVVRDLNHPKPEVKKREPVVKAEVKPVMQDLRKAPPGAPQAKQPELLAPGLAKVPPVDDNRGFVKKDVPLVTGEVKQVMQGLKKVDPLQIKDAPKPKAQWVEPKIIDTQAIKKFVAQKGGVIKDLTIPMITLDPEVKSHLFWGSGSLTPESIIPLLKQKELIPDDEIMDSLYEVKALPTGTFSGAVFKVSLKDPSNTDKYPPAFIVKVLAWAYDKIMDKNDNTPMKELQDIQYLKTSPLMNFTSADPTSDLPDIKLSMDHFYYVDSEGEKHYVSIMPLAKGEDFYDTLTMNGLDTQKSFELVSSIGKSLGLVHYGLASPDIKEAMKRPGFDFSTFKTAIHGDFHGSNVYVDAATNKVSFIDNGSFAESVRSPKYFLEDIGYFYVMTRSGYLSMGVDSEINNIFEKLVDGYVSAFPVTLRPTLKDFILNHLKDLNFSLFQACDELVRNGSVQLKAEPWYFYAVFRKKIADAASSGQIHDILAQLSNDNWVREKLTS